MVAIKTWVPNELLKSADLNTAFLTAAQGYMPGVFTAPGPNVAIVAGAGGVELPMAAPVAGSDQGGFYQSGTNRIVIPAGLGGVYLVSLTINSSGGAQGDMRSAFCSAFAMGQRVWWAGGGAGLTSSFVAYLANLAAGATTFVDASAQTSNATMSLFSFRLVRLASFGPYA